MAKVRVKAPTAKELPYLNVGSPFDMLNASFITGSKGETIVVGGLGIMDGIVGPPDSFKSTIAHYITLSSANIIAASIVPNIFTYDTESSIKKSRLKKMAKRFKNIKDILFQKDGLTGEGSDDEYIWDISDHSEIDGTEFEDIIKDYVNELTKNGDKVKWTAFKNYTDYVPLITEVDSFSKMTHRSIMQALAKAKNDSEKNATNLRKGLYKDIFLDEMSRYTVKANMRIILTAHITKNAGMENNPMVKPTKKLTHLKQDEAIKSVSGNFYYLTSTIGKTFTSKPLKNPGTGLAEYPLKNIKSKNSNDLVTVKYTIIRSKNGPTGNEIDLVISKDEGLLPHLTCFHNIKNNDRFGLKGNLQSYALEFLPDVKLQRTTVRDKIDSNPKLRRALELTFDLLAIKEFYPVYSRMGLYLEPDELYKKIIENGYDWDEILSTRGWYTIDQYNEELSYYLSIVDLLKMANGSYKPYWHE